MWTGVVGSIAVSLFLALCSWSIVDGLVERPSPELLRYMAAIGATFLIAYAIETSSTVKGLYRRNARRENWIGGVVGIGFCGLLAIIVSLALAERAEVGHWTWVDAAGLSFAASSLSLLGTFIVVLPLLVYEWWRDGDSD